MPAFILGSVRIEVADHFRVAGANFPRPEPGMIAEGFDLRLFDADSGEPLRIVHGDNRLVEYWVGRKVVPVYELHPDDSEKTPPQERRYVQTGTKRGADFRARFWPEIKRRVGRYLAVDLALETDPIDLMGGDIDDAAFRLSGKRLRPSQRIPSGTVANIDCDFDSGTTSAPAENETATTVTVAADYFFVNWRGQLRFPLSSIAAGSTINDSDLQFNVTFTDADAGEGITANSYGTSGGTTDPDTDTAANKQTNSANGTALANIDCSSTGSKTGDLGATADGHIQANLSSPGFYSIGLVHWNQDSGERVEIEAIENAGSDPATLTVDYTAGTSSILPFVSEGMTAMSGMVDMRG